MSLFKAYKIRMGGYEIYLLLGKHVTFTKMDINRDLIPGEGRIFFQPVLTVGS